MERLGLVILFSGSLFDQYSFRLQLCAHFSWQFSAFLVTMGNGDEGCQVLGHKFYGCRSCCFSSPGMYNREFRLFLYW
jgi:hypothetical protein